MKSARAIAAAVLASLSLLASNAAADVTDVTVYLVDTPLQPSDVPTENTVVGQASTQDADGTNMACVLSLLSTSGQNDPDSTQYVYYFNEQAEDGEVFFPYSCFIPPGTQQDELSVILMITDPTPASASNPNPEIYPYKAGK